MTHIPPSEKPKYNAIFQWCKKNDLKCYNKLVKEPIDIHKISELQDISTEDTGITELSNELKLKYGAKVRFKKAMRALRNQSNNNNTGMFGSRDELKMNAPPESMLQKQNYKEIVISQKKRNGKIGAYLKSDSAIISGVFPHGKQFVVGSEITHINDEPFYNKLWNKFADIPMLNLRLKVKNELLHKGCHLQIQILFSPNSSSLETRYPFFEFSKTKVLEMLKTVFLKNANQHTIQLYRTRCLNTGKGLIITYFIDNGYKLEGIEHIMAELRMKINERVNANNEFKIEVELLSSQSAKRANRLDCGYGRYSVNELGSMSKTLGSLLYIVKGIDANRIEWYLVLIDCDKFSRFLEELKSDQMNLEDYGYIIDRAYGSEIGKDKVREQFLFENIEYF